MRGFTTFTLYAAALFFIWAGVSAAPDMKWPHTSEEWFAVNLVCTGLIAKLWGHMRLLNIA